MAAAEAACVPFAARSILLFFIALHIFILALCPSLSFPSLSLIFPHLSAPPPPPPSLPSTCNGSLIYVYDLPPQFNSQLLQNCSSISPAWSSICPTLSNHGLGMPFSNSPPWPASHAWYATDQFTAELIFHARLQHHPCATRDPALAAAFFVPFYAGLAVNKHLFVPGAVQERDKLCEEVLEWLQGQAPWRRSGGRDHFFVIGRITWDFRRAPNASGWGSSFLNMAPMRNATKLSIERDPWDEQEIGIPYPTSFHPSQEKDLQQWQDYVKTRGKDRPVLFSYAGGPRRQKSYIDLRQILLGQCEDAGNSTCMALDCSHNACLHPRPVMELFLHSTFCLQPPGDSATRRSTFDCLLAGGIPVFFLDKSAYLQYGWHLPSDPSSYSVFIAEEAVRNGSSRIEQVLRGISEEKVKAMQANVVDLIPSIVYAHPHNSLTRTADALDLAIKGVLSRIKAKALSS